MQWYETVATVSYHCMPDASGLEEDQIVNQGLQWTPPLEEEEKEEKEEKKNLKKMMIMMAIMSFPKRKFLCIMCRCVS
jgi:hypothetical protein